MEGGYMRLQLSCPNVQFVVGSPRAAPVAKALEDLGFEFSVRKVGVGEIASARGSVEVEVDTVEELLDLQRKIGLTLVIEDGRARLENCF
jgi:hypothetical protein